MNYRFRLLIIILLAVISAGCWDSKDIDKRSFVMGVAFDLEKTGQDLVMTLELPVLKSFETGTDGGSSNTKKTKAVISTTGTSIAKMAAGFEARLWRELSFGHTKVIIIGEELAREGIGEIIDFFDRNPKVERRLKLVIAQGEARDIFKTAAVREPIASTYLYQMLEVVTPTTRVITHNFQDSLRYLEHNGDTILPRVRGTDEELIVAGSALIKDYKFNAWLGKNETRAVAFIFNTVLGGVITANVDNINYSNAIRKTTTKIRPQLGDNNQLVFTIDINAKGDITEVFSEVPVNITEDLIKKIQAKLNQIIADDMHHTLKKFQELKTDPIGLSILTKRRYPKFWNQNKAHWKEVIVPEIKFEVKTNFIIRHAGILS